MNTITEQYIQAPRNTVFDVTTDLSRWPAILPHYRSIQYLERLPDHNVVRMAAHRDGIPISWVSEQRIDRERFEMHFRHLESFTKGMVVVWTYDLIENGTLVRIVHDLKFRVPVLAPVAHPIIGRFFIDNIARKTLHHFKVHLEAQK